ncbi:MAG: immunoglobulin-like domain-containing protein [Bacilli bacterium]|jgi:type II secretory pathway pseudopilin PulG
MRKKGFTLVEVLAVIIILNIILIISVVGAFSIIKKGKENTYKSLINSVLTSAKLYVSDNENIESELDLNGYFIITLNDLVTNNIIKDDLIDARTDESIPLTKKIVITRNNDFSLNYCYEDIDCYVPELLVDKLEETIVTSGEGLYQELDLNSNQVSYYKGSNPNNYLLFDGLLYKIIKINADKSVKLIYEGKKQGTIILNDGKIGFQPFSSSNNNFNDSTIKTYLQTWFDNNISVNNQSLITVVEQNFSNSIVEYQSDQLKSVFKTSEILNLGNIKVGLLTGYEYLNASLDASCTTISNCYNQNYLTKDYDYFLMIKDNNTDLIWQVNSNELAVISVLNESNIRPVINLKNNVLVGGGNGTFLDPYVIKNLGIKDQEKPTLKLIGDSEIDLIQNTSYVELGATATDNIDGDISDKIIIIENINNSVLGTYFVSYSVSDSSGNKKTDTRKVNVIE